MPSLAFYGSSLLSAYRNGAATDYRGLIRDLAGRGWRTTFYEPDAFERQQHRDIDPLDWAEVVVYPATEAAARGVIAEAARADVVVKASGVGVFDDLLLVELARTARPDAVRLFWDVDAPATLAEIGAAPDHPMRRVLPDLDLVLTYGGGPPVVEADRGIGARDCVPIYNALDPQSHHPVPAEARFSADLAFLGNRLPDREARVEEFYGDGSQTRSFCYVDDLIDGLYRLMEHGEAREVGAVNLGNPVELMVSDLVRRVLSLTGSPSAVVHHPLPVDDPRRRRPDIARASELLGWAPRVPLEQGLRATVMWFSDEAEDGPRAAARPGLAAPAALA